LTGSVSWIAPDEAADGLSKQNIPSCLVDPSGENTLEFVRFEVRI
jgi:hypothetical protein